MHTNVKAAIKANRTIPPTTIPTIVGVEIAVPLLSEDGDEVTTWTVSLPNSGLFRTKTVSEAGFTWQAPCKARRTGKLS